MISVLIPIFNTDVRELVNALSNQLVKTKQQFEICLLDDGSLKEYQIINRELNNSAYCNYKEYDTNKGRLHTRKELASTAQYPWLLFIDADCVINNSQYISNYLDHFKEGTDVIIGGTAYSKVKPSDCVYHLHWLYGSKRIATYTSTSKKKENPYQGFLFNNVLIKKDLFLSLSFPKQLQGYGHEDTWVGMQFEMKNIKLIKTNNPVLHPQLDEAAAFLQKNIYALNNLKQLLSISPESQIAAHVKIYRYYKLLRKYKITKLFNFFIQLLENKLKKNLSGCTPSLILFDLFRLYHLNKIMQD